MSDSATSWIIACQAPLSVEYSRPETWSRKPFPCVAQRMKILNIWSFAEEWHLLTSSDICYAVLCLVANLCLTLCDTMDYARLHRPWDSPGKNTGVGCQALFRGSSQPRDKIHVSCPAGGFFTIWTTREAPPTSLSLSHTPTHTYIIHIFLYVCVCTNMTWSIIRHNVV